MSFRHCRVVSFKSFIQQERKVTHFVGVGEMEQMSGVETTCSVVDFMLWLVLGLKKGMNGLNKGVTG